MSGSHGVWLKDLHRDADVEAQLIERVDAAFAKRADDAWQPFIAMAKAKALAANAPSIPIEHAHWTWFEKVEDSAHLLSYRIVGIECDGHVQGLMMVLTDGFFSRVRGQERFPLAYVMYIATAPWNYRPLTPNPWYAGVGTVLLGAAVELSLELGFKGRIGLHSLSQAEPFYECHGMVCLGIDAAKQHMKYYEFTEEQARAFIREE